jgi:ketosteroid isomerase-like protein
MKTPGPKVTIVLLAILSACTAPKPNAEELIKVEQEIMDVEKAFSDYSEKNGFSKALVEYASDDLIKLNHLQYATIGKEQLQKEMEADSIGAGETTLTWKPLKVHVAESGDMAAAFGEWCFKFKSLSTAADSTVYGNYVTVWEKQADRSWKFFIDAGNPTPGPTPVEMLELLK